MASLSTSMELTQGAELINHNNIQATPTLNQPTPPQQQRILIAYLREDHVLIIDNDHLIQLVVGGYVTQHITCHMYLLIV